MCAQCVSAFGGWWLEERFKFDAAATLANETGDTLIVTKETPAWAFQVPTLRHVWVLAS